MPGYRHHHPRARYPRRAPAALVQPMLDSSWSVAPEMFIPRYRLLPQPAPLMLGCGAHFSPHYVSLFLWPHKVYKEGAHTMQVTHKLN